MRTRSRRRVRRGFNLVELLMALAITAALLSATMVALNASFIAYQRTTEEASTHTIALLALHRMLTLIRTGSEFGPYPIDPKNSVVMSDVIEFRSSPTTIVTLEYNVPGSQLELTVLDEETGTETKNVILSGLKPLLNDKGERIKPFTLEYELGRKLYRATIDLTVVADDDASLVLEQDHVNEIRLIASAMPRSAAFSQ